VRRLRLGLRQERGLAAVEVTLFTGLILFPVLILVASLPTWWERQSLARLAAQEAARTVALAGTWDDGAEQGHALVVQMAVNHGVDPADLSLQLGGALERGGEVTAAVTVTVPTMVVPFIVEVPSFTLSSTHTEAVDLYRSFPAP
jgi:hypothetical protein